MKSLSCKLLAAVLVVAVLAGCAVTGPQQDWFGYVDYMYWLSSGD